jgi:hypothetical protein
MMQILQMVGAVVLLAAFAARQAGTISDSSWLYLLANTAGAADLAVTALVGQDWGFVVLEGAWAVISAVALRKCWRAATPAPTTTDLRTGAVDATRR